MPERDLAGRLDAAIEERLARAERAARPADAELAPLWDLAVALMELPRPGHRARLRAELERRAKEMQQATTTPHVRSGLRSVTPYLVVEDADRLIRFAAAAFGARELVRVHRPDGSVEHAEIRIGDSVVELGEGVAPHTSRPAAIHLYVPDADAAYARALEAGAVSLVAPTDMPYGDREGDVRDPLGNNWYIGTRLVGGPIPPGLHSVTPALHVAGADRLIAFAERAFGAETVERDEGPGGEIVHARLRVGDSIVELSEARGGFGPMPATLHLYVPDADATYAGALEAGATSLSPPAATPYGDRMAGVADAHGNRWFVATHLGIRDRPTE